MTQLLPYAAFLAVLAALVLAAGVKVRARTMALHGLLSAALVLAAVDGLGRPKPLWAELRDREALEIVAAQYHPGLGIYIWVRASPPVVYALPWDVGMAREMQEAVRASGGALLVPDGEDYGDWQAHPMPQPISPEKES